MTDTPNRPPLSPLAQAVVDAHYGAPAMTTPNRPPLWEAMADAVINAPPPTNSPTGTIAAAQIRALRDWLVPEEPQEEPYVNTDLGWLVNTDNAHRWAERQRLRAMLTTEADRAERGDG